MLDAAGYRLRAVPAPMLPVARMVIGMPVVPAAALLPRLFNLCRVAQETAARAAFGLSFQPGWRDDLRSEIQREHVLKLCLKWPGFLSLPAVTLPRNWQVDCSALRIAVFGPEGRVSQDWEDFTAWLASGDGASTCLRAIADVFKPGEAIRQALPGPDATAIFGSTVLENSAAARHVEHPILRQIEAQWGRGPFWSAMGVALDLEALLDGALPDVSDMADCAVVPAARGLYGVKASVVGGKVASFERVTPTDNLLAQGGALDQSLASLPAAKAKAHAPLLLSVLDPCFPVTLQKMGELTDA